MTKPADVRFGFGKNWKRFIAEIRDDQITRAHDALLEFHGAERLRGCDFIDIGCGSGLHSLAAVMAGAATVLSVDYDLHSVESAQQLKTVKAPSAAWEIRQVDILSPADLKSLRTYDLVYSWGVLHHTGAMWSAITNTLTLVKPQGWLHIAIYNRHRRSGIWKFIKGTYVRCPGFLQQALLGVYAVLDVLRMLWRRQNPLRVIRSYKKDRGMRWLINLRDWLGGYPYEYASAAEITDFVCSRGFKLVKTLPNSGTGCAEFLFQKERL